MKVAYATHESSVTLPVGVDDTGQQSKGTGALLGTSPLAEEPGNHPVPQGPFRFVIGQRQIGMDDDDPECFPVIEK